MSDTWQLIWLIVATIIGLICLIWIVLWVARPWPPPKPKGPEVVWHQLPAMRGDGTMPCCGRYPAQVPGHDKITPNPYQVTCGRIAGQARRAA